MASHGEVSRSDFPLFTDMSYTRDPGGKEGLDKFGADLPQRSPNIVQLPWKASCHTARLPAL